VASNLAWLGYVVMFDGLAGEASVLQITERGLQVVANRQPPRRVVRRNVV